MASNTQHIDVLLSQLNFRDKNRVKGKDNWLGIKGIKSISQLIFSFTTADFIGLERDFKALIPRTGVLGEHSTWGICNLSICTLYVEQHDTTRSNLIMWCSVLASRVLSHSNIWYGMVCTSSQWRNYRKRAGAGRYYPHYLRWRAGEWGLRKKD